MELETRSNTFSLVLNFPPETNPKTLLKRLYDTLKENTSEFYFILHDQDVLEDGTPKTPHVHLVLRSNTRRRAKYWITHIGEGCKIPAECVSIQLVDSYPLSIQYLCHKNDENKHKYDEEEVITNKPNNFATYYVMDIQGNIELQFEYLVDVIQRHHYNMLKIIKEIGLKNFQQYRNTIYDVVRWLKLDEENEIEDEAKVNELLNYPSGQTIKK